MSYRAYTDEEFIQAVIDNKSIAGVLKQIGLKPVGSNYYTAKRKIQKLKLDTSHFTGQSWNKDKKMKDWSDYTRAVNVKPHLIKMRGHKCELCGASHWFDKLITLEIHHIDCDRTNNNESNLQLLCPNCHSYTDGWRKRSK